LLQSIAKLHLIVQDSFPAGQFLSRTLQVFSKTFSLDSNAPESTTICLFIYDCLIKGTQPPHNWSQIFSIFPASASSVDLTDSQRIETDLFCNFEDRKVLFDDIG